MAPRIPTRFLLIDADAAQQQTLALALDTAGLQAQAVGLDPQAIEAALQTEQPVVVLLRAEPGTDALGHVLRIIEQARGSFGCPVVLLCNDTRDETGLRQMTTGVVEMLKLPFNARLHTSRLRLLPEELPQRTGELRGKGTGAQLRALIEHFARVKRTGGLQVNEGQPDEGRAFFSRGALLEASFGHARGAQALEAMTRMAQGNWHFSEGAAAPSVLELDPIEVVQPAAPALPVAKPTAEIPAPLGYGARRQAPVDDSPLELADAPTLSMPAAVAVPTFGSPGVPAPQRDAPIEATPSSVSPEAASTPLLFVDDDAALLQMLGTYFGKKGYPVTLATDGIEAMQKLLSSGVEAVVADLNMPRLDGWGLLRAVRDDYRTNELPVALFSCHDDYKESLRALHAGASAYYSKSLRMNALEAQLRELLEPRRRFKRLLAEQMSVVVPLSPLGPQWVLRALATARFMGQLDARDTWSTWRLHFVSGALVHAAATVAGQEIQGDPAMLSFLSSRGSEGSVAPGLMDVPPHFGGASTETTLQRLVGVLNEETRRLRDEAMKSASGLDVDNSLYTLYQKIGPPAWRPHVALLCEQKLPPREVMQRTGIAPQELQGLIRDLIRRGVVSLRKA